MFGLLVSTIPKVPKVYDLVPITTSDQIYSSSSDDTRKVDQGMCSQMFVVHFVTPAIDSNVIVKGHLSSGNIMFAEDPSIITMGHISPTPDDLNFSCAGKLSGTTEILHQEQIICVVESDHEFLKTDLFIQNDNQLFKTNDIQLVDLEINEVEHTKGERVRSHTKYIITFYMNWQKMLDKNKLLLILLLADGTFVFPKMSDGTEISEGFRHAFCKESKFENGSVVVALYCSSRIIQGFIVYPDRRWFYIKYRFWSFDARMYFANYLFFIMNMS